MSEQLIVRDFFLEPGYVCLPVEPTRLAAVVSSGVAVLMYDTRRRRGGMSHYIYPLRRFGLSTAMFACPSIVALTRMFLDSGSAADDLEARLIGGASNPDHPGFEPTVSAENVRVGLEVLARYAVRVAGQDVGGSMPRKLVFHTGTGELTVATVERVRESDWYPPL